MSAKLKPPGLAKFLLERCLWEEEVHEKLGDFEEGFYYKAQEKGLSTARFWYNLQVLKYIPTFIKCFIYWSFAMLKSYIKIAMRNILRHKGYSFINIAGLAVGMACCILILLWVKDEVGTDQFHEKIDNLYQIRTIQHYGSEVSTGSGSIPILGPTLREEYPEVINAARFQNGQSQHLLEYGNKQFKEDCQMADPEVFEVFTFPFLIGDPKDAFGDPYVMVLSQNAAERIFGSEDPVGKILALDKKEDFRIVGVMQDIPHNSSHRFDIWIPLEIATKWYRPNYLSTWYNMAFRTYLEMAPGIDVEAFNEKIFNRIRQAHPETILEPLIYPFSRLYLDYRMDNIRIFSIIAFVILFIACINFMNLSTARSAHRAREVGLRKVVGAHRNQVTRQFFGESVLLTSLSLIFAIGAAMLLLPAFRSLTAKPLVLSQVFDPTVLLGVICVALVTGFLAGSYPALFLSGFRPITVLKGRLDSGKRGSLFRKALVVLQFALSIMLIIGTAVIFNQVNLLKSKSLGFDKEHVLGVRLEGKLIESVDAVKAELLSYSGIQSVSATSHSPTGVYNNGDGWDWEGRDPNVNPLVTYFGVDPDFLTTFKMEIAEGESFRPAAGGSTPQVLVNQTFADIMGHPSVVGMRLSSEDTQLQIIGVVKDFHYTPAYQEIGPAIVYFDPTYTTIARYRFLFMRLNPGDIPASIAHIEKTIRSFNPGFPFEYQFLDESYDRLYRSTEREMALVRTFTVLAILISCLGLFGLAAYTAERRTKEIGIRKVMGASVTGITLLLSKEYAKWVLAANLIAWPASFFLMKSWLQDYPYRTSLGIPVFILAAAIAFLIAQLTVSFQAIKAARSNPSDSLRYE